MEQTVTLAETLTLLNDKIDRLATQVTFLTEEAQRQKQRQQPWDELQAELAPLSREMLALSTQQLAELQPEVQLEDLGRLFKRLLRNTRNLEQLLDQGEGLLGLWEDVSPLSRQAFMKLITLLEEMDRKGYFVFLQGGLNIADQVVTSFTGEDIEQLGDNIVLILQTVKEMTQPEIMTMMRQTAHLVKTEEPADASLINLIRQLNDPAVRRGLAKTLQVLKSVA